MNREVTEIDLRKKEFQDPRIKLDDLEFDTTGSIVRKDRWESVVRRCAMKMGACGRDAEYEVDHVAYIMDWLLDQIPDYPYSEEQKRLQAEEERRESEEQKSRDNLRQIRYEDEHG